MRFNQDALKNHALSPGDKEGKLAHKTPKEGYRDRWIKLNGNLLYYFKLNDFGTAKAFEPPVGVIVLEGCRVRLEPADKHPFVFSIECLGDVSSAKHYIGCHNKTTCQEWVEALQNASHAFMKIRLESLQSEIQRITKQNPAVLYTVPSAAGYSQPIVNSFSSTSAKAPDRPAMSRASQPLARPQVVIPKKNSQFFTDWESFQ